MEGRHLTPSRYGPAVVAYKSVRCVLAWDEPDLPAPEQRGRAVVDAITDGTTARLDQLQGLPARPSWLSNVISKLRLPMPTTTPSSPWHAASSAGDASRRPTHDPFTSSKSPKSEAAQVSFFPRWGDFVARVGSAPMRAVPSHFLPSRRLPQGLCRSIGDGAVPA
jgi:hypothetical protein